MPRIPDGRDMERLTPVSDRPITSVNQESFVSGIGRDMQSNYNHRAREDEAALERDRRSRIRLQTAKAKSAWLRERTDASKALENDQDYRTHEERYNKRIGEAQPEIAGLIDDPEARVLFEEQMEADSILSTDAVRLQAFKVESQVELASLSELLSSNKDAYLEGDQITRMELIEASADMIEAAQERGYLNPAQAQQLRESTTNDYLTAKLNGMEPREQIEFLTGDPQAEMLPVDVRQKIEKTARVNLKLDDALGHADRLIGEFGDDRARVMDGISKIQDPNVRTEARAQANARLSQMGMALAEDQARAYDGFLSQMAEGRSLGDLRREQPEAWMEMGGVKQTALISASAQTKKPTTNLASYAKVNQIHRQKGAEAAQKFLWENAQKFTSGDFKSMENKLSTALMSDESKVDSIFSDIKRIENFGLDRNLNEDDIGQLQRSYDVDRQKFQHDNGREPTLIEERQLLDGLMLEFDNQWFRFDQPDDAVMFDMTEQERRILEVHFVAWEDKFGKAPTDEEKNNIRNAAYKKGVLSE